MVANVIRRFQVLIADYKVVKDVLKIFYAVDYGYINFFIEQVNPTSTSTLVSQNYGNDFELKSIPLLRT